MNQRAALIAQMARQRGLDPAAVLSIASVEGGFNGAIGDNGTSFGPFQMHEGGALPSGRGNQWANSRQGIAYALDHIASVARGLHGRQAIAAISSRFERPANVPAEIAKAASRYGQFSHGSFPTGGASALSNAMMGGSMPSPSGGGDGNVANLISFLMQQNQMPAAPQSRFVPFQMGAPSG